MKFVDQKIEDYCIQMSHQPSAVCAEIYSYTQANVAQAQMLIGPMEASVLGFLIRCAGVKRVLEFGCFTGYSALAMAEHLPENGELITLDINQETTDIAQGFWNKSEHGKKIKAIVGPARESFQKLEGNFDLFFIDADKENYPNYLEFALSRMSERGVIVCDNMLWSGDVLKTQNEQSKAAKTLDQLSRDCAKNQKLCTSLLPIRDGMLLIQKI